MPDLSICTVKIKDEVIPVLETINQNLKQANQLLIENKELLTKVVKGSLEVVSAHHRENRLV